MSDDTPEDLLAGQLAEQLVLAMNQPEPFKVVARWIIDNHFTSPATTLPIEEIGLLARCQTEKDQLQRTINYLREHVNRLADDLGKKTLEIEERAQALMVELTEQQKTKLALADKLIHSVEEHYRLEEY